MGKKYWWLKLPEDFFRQIEIKKLRKIAGGDTYTIIYLKTMLLSLKNEGRIAYDCSENEFVENLALDIDEDEENVALTVAFLRKYNLIVESDGLKNEISLPKAAEAIGSETAAASRMRAMRERQKSNESVTMLQDGYGDVTHALRRDRDREEKRREELEQEQNKKVPATATAPNPYALWDSNICPMTGLLKERLEALVEEVGELYVCQAIESAVLNGVRSFNYVQAAARGIAAGKTKQAKQSAAGFSGEDLIESLYGKGE